MNKEKWYMRKYLIVFVILGCIAGCKQSEKSDNKIIIPIDLEKMHEIDLQGEYAMRICLTDNGNPALVDEVKKILFVEGQYIIQGRNKILAFDAQSGVCKMSFSGQGRARDEFISLWDAWIEGKTICIYDMNGKKILRYDFNGNLSEVISIADKASNYPFQVLAKTIGGYYVGKRVYGSVKHNIELNLYDKDFEFVKEIGDLKIESGIYLGYPFFVYSPTEVLYHRYLYNDIYAIDDKQNVTVKYYVDFGENNVPLNPNFKDEYDRFDFVNTSKKDYGTLVSNIYESDKYFCFRFLCERGKCLGVYDKSSGEAASFVFTPFSSASIIDVYVFDDKALLVTQDMDKTCLTTISVDDLLKNNR